MKTKMIFALLTALLLGVFSIQAAGLVDESSLLLGPAKACRLPKATQPSIGKDKPEVTAAADEVLIKLFDADGELVGVQSATMEEFMAGDFTHNCLPIGTTFVMFHGQIAYYQTSTDGAAKPGA